MATVFTLADSIRSSGLEWALLEGIADQNLLVASAFSEGEPGRGVLSPKVTGKSTEGGILVSGSKRPCSIARSMDLLSASAVITDEDGAHRTVVLLLPANSPGISVHPFWRSNVLAGAESDEVRLNDVFVDEKLILPVTSEADGSLDELQTTGFIWFEMMIASCYLGMATALVSQAIKRPGIGKQRIAEMGIRLETAAMLLDSIAHLILDGETGNAALARATIARYGAEDAIVDVANYAVRALGGMSFISSSDVAYLAAACQCLQFHPPSRIAGDSAVCAGLVGESFVIR
ncbi:acyl-CoA dehydrogenase [Nocardia fluminea]|uniref:acyl-CoA dehydrogenase n=1 Tax=Nocardia fluminea TaxID=134984 RepID=UPI003670CFCE